MPDYLCISVTFLDPFFHGKRDDEKPEWPPSPMRLFQALLAGSRTGRRMNEWSNAKEKAFRWLEQCEPPMIIAPAAKNSTAWTIFVPNNDSDKKYNRQDRLTSKIFKPQRLLDGDTLYYLWLLDQKDVDFTRKYAELLCREARYLIALGWGIDQVVGAGCILKESETSTLPGQRWRALTEHRPGQRTYRVPVEGSFEDLENVFRSFLQRIEGRRYNPPLKFTRYGIAGYFRRLDMPPRSYAIFELPEGIAFRQEDTVRVAAMLRSLTCKIAQGDTHRFPCESEQYVAGHIKEKDPGQSRFSYYPLPTIGGKYSDGMIRRLLIAEPFNGSGRHVRWAQNRLRGKFLKDKYNNDICILHDLWRIDSEKIVRRYVNESRSWCSVTPVILPGYDDFKTSIPKKSNKPTKAERLLFKCLIHAGIPSRLVKSVAMRKAPFWLGSQHPKRYCRPDYLADYHARPGWHVRILFHEPLAGPLSIGAGRHCGLGILAGKED